MEKKMYVARGTNISRVDHPSYYDNGAYIIIDGIKHSIECIDVIRNMPSWKGNAIKYLWREGSKQEEGLSNIDKEIEDLEKAVWYIKDKIESLKLEKNV